jgi:uncharacterized membrane protein
MINYIKLLKLLLVALLFTLPFLVYLRYHALHTSIADLGFFLNNISNAEEDMLRMRFGHIQPLMFIYKSFLNIFPDDWAPFLLLESQAFITIISVFLIWRFIGPIAASAMILYPPLWINTLFDFHFDHLSILILTIFFISAQKNKYYVSFISAILLCFVKEIFALQSLMCGVYLLLLSFDRDIILRLELKIYGLVIIFFSSLYFILCLYILFPNQSFDSYLSLNINNSFSDSTNIFNSALLNFLDISINFKKIFYILLVFGLLVFIPLLSPKPLIIIFPIIIISLISKSENYFDFYTHYTAGIIVPLVIAFNNGIKIIIKYLPENKFLPIVFTIILVGNIMISPSPISRLFFTNKIWNYSWQAYFATRRDDIIKGKIIDLIPSNRDITISSQNNLNYWPLANRKNYFVFPYGVTVDPFKNSASKNSSEESTGNFLYADFVLIDLKRPPYYLDRGCNWTYGQCLDKIIESNFKNAIEEMQLKYSLIYQYDNFFIYRQN